MEDTSCCTSIAANWRHLLTAITAGHTVYRGRKGATDMHKKILIWGLCPEFHEVACLTPNHSATLRRQSTGIPVHNRPLSLFCSVQSGSENYVTAFPLWLLPNCYKLHTLWRHRSSSTWRVLSDVSKKQAFETSRTSRQRQSLLTTCVSSSIAAGTSNLAFHRADWPSPLQQLNKINQ
jgi:hypothetical protein